MGLGPSPKTWPWCPPQRLQWYSVRGTISLKSTLVPIALGRGCQKLGQPVPLSYLAFELNRARSQPAQWKVPARFSLLSGLLKGRSVPSWRST